MEILGCGESFELGVETGLGHILRRLFKQNEKLVE
jgi:hypothetical protein